MKKWHEQLDILLGIAVVSIVAMLVIPIPAMLLDMLLGISIMIGLITLLTAMYNNKSSDFSVFPSLLLVTTVYRLALNVSSTRLILSEGPAFEGQLIRAFGEFVVAGNYVIGFVIFLILIFVQMMVITKGATRISEVAARFTLDALPGKQMSIDSDLAANILTEEEARQKRDELRKEVDFYGQMDGATKFVQGDVRVGLVITGINIIGGLVIGMVMHNMSAMAAVETFTLLTIGDGLVAQVPSLLITTATGLVVTRASSKENIAQDISRQLFYNPRVIWIVAATLGASSIIPGFPKLPLITIAVFMGFIAYLIQDKKTKDDQRSVSEEKQKKAGTTEKFLDEITIEPLKLEIGYNLVPLVSKEQGGNLLEKITMLRQKLAREMGMIVPPIRINDNMDLDGNEYAILVNGIEVAKAKAYPDKLVALNRGKVTEEMAGDPYKDPTFHVDSLLIPKDKKEEADGKGYLVVDANNIVITHLSETLKDYSTQIMGREEIKLLLDKAKEKYPSVVEEVKKNMNPGAIQQVFHNLLKENISVRNLVVILEALADHCENVKDTVTLTEMVRQRLGIQIVNQYAQDGKVKVIQVDPLIENELRKAMHFDEKEGRSFSVQPNVQLKIRDALLKAFNAIQQESNFPVFITSSEVRMGVFMILERELSTRAFTVLAYEEIPQNIKLEFRTQAIIQSEQHETVFT